MDTLIPTHTPWSVIDFPSITYPFTNPYPVIRWLLAEYKARCEIGLDMTVERLPAPRRTPKIPDLLHRMAESCAGYSQLPYVLKLAPGVHFPEKPTIESLWPFFAKRGGPLWPKSQRRNPRLENRRDDFLDAAVAVRFAASRHKLKVHNNYHTLPRNRLPMVRQFETIANSVRALRRMHINPVCFAYVVTKSILAEPITDRLAPGNGPAPYRRKKITSITPQRVFASWYLSNTKVLEQALALTNAKHRLAWNFETDIRRVIAYWEIAAIVLTHFHGATGNPEVQQLISDAFYPHVTWRMRGEAPFTHKLAAHEKYIEENALKEVGLCDKRLARYQWVWSL